MGKFFIDGIKVAAEGTKAQHISHYRVGGKVYDKQQMLAFADAGEKFYVRGSRNDEVEARVWNWKTGGTKTSRWFETAADGKPDNNLMSLPRICASCGADQD